MNIKGIMKIVGCFIKKNSPMILAGTGAAAIGVGSFILVDKARKSDEMCNEVYNDIVVARTDIEAYKVTNNEDKDLGKQLKKALLVAYVKGFGKYVKHYICPILLISGGVGCMFSGTVIQTKRLQKMASAYTALASAFAAYRERVKQAIGEEHENDIFHGIKKDKDGNIVTVDEKHVNKPLDNTETFSRLFGDGNTIYWSKDPRLNVVHLRSAEATCNQIMRQNGFITLNQVYHELGFRPSAEGMYLGWRFRYGDPIYGDTYVDLGFAGPKNEEKCEQLRHEWNTEIWIDLIPPHNLIDLVPKEIKRSKQDKLDLLKKRNSVGSFIDQNTMTNEEMYKNACQTEYVNRLGV